MRTLLAFLCLLPLAYAETQTSVQYALKGVDGFEVVANKLILVPEGSKPELVPVGKIVVETEAAIVEVEARNESCQTVPVEELTRDDTTRTFITYGPGTLEITIRMVDFDLKIWKTEKRTLEITPPEPPLPPKPIVDLAQISYESRPNEPETISGLIANLKANTSYLKLTPTEYERAVVLYKSAIGNALALRPRGSQADWLTWRKEVDAGIVKAKVTSTTELITAYEAVTDGLER
jgi:hypothetical protein